LKQSFENLCLPTYKASQNQKEQLYFQNHLFSYGRSLNQGSSQNTFKVVSKQYNKIAIRSPIQSKKAQISKFCIQSHQRHMFNFYIQGYLKQNTIPAIINSNIQVTDENNFWL
jgi:hypothetical protein